MKRNLIRLGIVGSLCLLTSCGVNEKNIIKLTNPEIEFNNRIVVDGYDDYCKTLISFNSKITDGVLNGVDDNVCLSPLSLYMALSMACEAADGLTREEILNTLGVTYDDLKKYSSIIYNKSNLNEENFKELIVNSMWIDKNTKAKEECLKSLENNYKAYLFGCDFYNDNKNVNKKIRSFVKENTFGLIDENLNISDNTKYLIMNNLYFSDLWHSSGEKLKYTNSEYSFYNSDTSITKTKLLYNDYKLGRINDYDMFKTFYTTTSHGYRIHFIVPKDGYSLNEIMNEDIISKAILDKPNTNIVDNKVYYTRCVFPEFSVNNKLEVKTAMEKLGVKSLFNENCDFTNLCDSKLMCDNIIQNVKLDVNKKGIEGASVSYIPMCGDVGPDKYTHIYEDFVVDRAFGFVITDPDCNVLFSGKINKI